MTLRRLRKNNKRPETFHISTYGCRMNLADSSTLASSLTTRGYRRVRDESDADLIVLNTCSVREKAEQRVIGRLGEILKHKRRKPHMKIAVVGCMAQRLGGEVPAAEREEVIGEDGIRRDEVHLCPVLRAVVRCRRPRKDIPMRNRFSGHKLLSLPAGCNARQREQRPRRLAAV